MIQYNYISKTNISILYIYIPYSPTGIQFLPAIVSLFPILDTCLIKTSLKILLQAEVILECSAPVNVFTYYAPNVRSWWKKGLYLSQGTEEQIGRAVIQKRTKVRQLCILVKPKIVAFFL